MLPSPRRIHDSSQPPVLVQKPCEPNGISKFSSTSTALAGLKRYFRDAIAVTSEASSDNGYTEPPNTWHPPGSQMYIDPLVWDAVFYVTPAALENEAEVVSSSSPRQSRQALRRVALSSIIHPVLSELENHAAKAPVEEALLDSGME